MPNSVATNPLDILVQNNPGTKTAPVVAGGDGAYYELRGRPLRVPNPVGSAGPVPRLRLGFSLSIVQVLAAVSGTFPGAQLSASLAALAAGSTIPVPTFTDPAGGPAIRLVGGTIGEASTAGQIYIVSLLISEPKDEDRDPTGT